MGLAMVARGAGPVDRATRLRSVRVGTADFISPEQALGESQDQRSDIYSLGATLYALVAGSPPYKGHTTQLLMQHQFADPPKLSKRLKSSVPDDLNDVIAKMMAKKVADRYQTAEEVIEALTPFVSTESWASRKPRPKRGSGKARARPGARLPPEAPPRKSKGWWMVAAGALLAVVVSVGGWLALSGPTEIAGAAHREWGGAVPRGRHRPRRWPTARSKWRATKPPSAPMGRCRASELTAQEFLKANVNISRGLYLWQDWKVPKLENVQQTGNVVTAKGDAGTPVHVSPAQARSGDNETRPSNT